MRKHLTVFVTLLFSLIALGIGTSHLLAVDVGSGSGCKVNSVHDGDTLRVTCDGQKVKVRLYCIDTPELSQRPWGIESRDHLRSLIEGEVVLVEHGKDRYGRILAEVYSKDKNLNLLLVESGMAAVYTKYCKLDDYYRSQDVAHNQQLGIWSKPGLQQTPWIWRKQHRH